MKTYFTIALLLIGITAHAQSKTVKRKIEAAKIALITERLNLTPAKAQVFWPVYNEYNLKRREIRQSINESRRNINVANATDKESAEAIQKTFEAKRQQLDLEETYSTKFLEVITAKQLILLQKTEEEFKEMILRRIQEDARMKNGK